MKITADMRKITPSAYAEEAYQAARAGRAYPAVVGPAGIAIPDPRQRFRSTIDPKLLTTITRAAQADLQRELQSKEREVAMVAALAVALEAHFVPADMEILRRYGCAEVTSSVSVELGRYNWRTYTMADPMLLPPQKGGHPRFRTSEGITGLPLPEATLPWFDDLAVVEDARKEQDKIWLWPGQHKVAHGELPTWAQLAAAWPRIGAWMAAQREQGR